MKKSTQKKDPPVSGRFAKLFSTLLVSCAPIILVSLCVAILLAMNSLRRIDEESRRVLDQNFSNAVSEVEWELSGANSLNYRLSVNYELTSYLSLPRRDYYQEYGLRKMLAGMAGIGGVSCSETVLYMSGYDYVLATDWGAERTTHYSADEAQRLLWKIGDMASPRISAMKIMSSGGGDGLPQIVFVRAASQGEGAAYIITTVDTPALNAKVRGILWRDTDHLIVYNNEGVLLSTMDDGDTRATYREISRGADRFAGADASYELSYRDSAQMGLKYAFVSSPLSAVALVRNTSLSTIGFILLTMLVLIGYVFWLNYRPLQKTMKKLDIDPGDGVNDLAAIENTVQHYIARNDELNRQVASSEDRMRRLYLEKLIEGRIGRVENIRESLSLYNLFMPRPRFMVALLQSGDSVMFLSDDRDEAGTLEEILLNSLRQRRMDVFAFGLAMDDGCVFVFNGGEEDLTAIRESVLNQVCRVAGDWLRAEYAFSVSRLHDAPEKLPQAYREALAGAAREEPARPSADSGGAGELSARCQGLIHERYADVDFSVALIAEEMGLSPSYLSRMFKQQVGVGLLEYIHRYRVMKARQLLEEDSQISLEETARRTGFYNVAALIRVFKKIEDMTPGQYRDSVGNGQNLNSDK